MFSSTRRLLGALSLLAIPTVALAQQSPSFDCSNAQSIVEFAICADPKLTALDALLGSAYKNKLSQLDEFSRSFEREEQRDWVKRRNKECGGAESLHEVADCISSSILNRLGELPGDGVNEAEAEIVPREAAVPGFFAFKVCNQTSDQASVVVAHRQSISSGLFMIRGWYHISPNNCMMVGEFPQGNFYFFARAGAAAWAGDHPVCTKNSIFARWDTPGSKCDDSALKGFSAVTVDQDIFTVNLNGSGTKDQEETNAGSN